MRITVFAFTLIFLVAGAFAEEQTAETEIAPRSEVEVRRVASERLLRQEKIELSMYRGSIVFIVIYPTEKKMQACRGTKECFVGKMPVENIYVNPMGYLTVTPGPR